MYDVIIIGCGVVGAATAYQLAKYRLRTLVLEAQNDVANGTTKANSAIIHAGYDPEPGTQMARLNVQGNRMAGEICEKLGVPFARVGSLVLAFCEAERQTLETLFQRGQANGVPGLRLLDGAGARAMEPNLSEAVQAALYAPSAGIVDPWRFALAMAETAVENGVQLCLQSPVTAIGKTPGGFCVQTPRGAYEARYVFNAAGVQADEVHALLEAPGYAVLDTLYEKIPGLELVAEDLGTCAPRCWNCGTATSRGEYYLMDKSQGAQVGRIIFQCPSQSGKGVLVAPTVHGNLIVGPNAEPVPDKRDVGTTGAGLAYVRKTALRSVPGLNFRENIRNFAGLRAVSTRDDFILEESAASPGFFDLAGIKSPGLTSAPAIGALAVQLLRQKGVALEEKPAFRERRRAACFAALSAEEKNALIQKDARYGRVICRCETITEGEIVAALHSPIPPHSLNGVKRRCNAGMGRCQGGFCGPRVQAIIARELGIPQQEVLMDQDGTYLITGETKQGRGGVQHV